MARVPAGARAIFRGTGVSPCPPGELGGQGSFFPMGLFLYGSVTSLAACVVDNFRENGIIAEGAFPQRERVKKKRRGVAQLVARLLWEQDAGCSSHLTPTSGVPPQSRPTRPPRKRGPFLSHRILVTAWSLNIQSVLHRCGVPPRSRPTRPSALPVEGRWSVPGDKTSKMPRDNRACRHSHALPGPLERGGHTLCTEF